MTDLNKDLVDDFENKLDELLEYLNSARRMNREKIFQDILNIKLDSIRKSSIKSSRFPVTS